MHFSMGILIKISKNVCHRLFALVFDSHFLVCGNWMEKVKGLGYSQSSKPKSCRRNGLLSYGSLFVTFFIFMLSFMFPFKIKSLNVGRYGHCAVSYDGSIYTFGGRTSNYECISELEVYGQDGWTSLNEVNLLPRYHFLLT